ncbi:MAG: amidohydrolase family protein [Gemmatimonadota bacterium]|nr:amidohydrolase family protein [Gemmatimonadota bacterium]
MSRQQQRFRAFVSLVALCVSMIPLARAAAQVENALAITNVTVVPMDRERVLRGQTVLIRGGRIVSVGPTNTVVIPASVMRIDGTGRFLIPGLVDAHVHYDEDAAGTDPHIDEINAEFSRLFLSAGVTEVMNLCGSSKNLALRDSIASEEVDGPTMLTSPHCFNDSTMTEAQGEAAATQAKREGYDFLKVYSFLSSEGFRGIMSAAKGADIPVVGHIPQRVGTQAMLEDGAVGIVHAEEFLYNAPFRLQYGDPHADAVQLDTAHVAGIAHAVRRARVAVTPTLIAYSSIIDEAVSLDAVLAKPELRLVSNQVKKSRGWYAADNGRARRLGAPMPLSRLRLGLAMQKRLVRAFRDSGVTLLAGTDAGGSIPMTPGWSLHDEMQLLVGAGLTPYEALRAATANAGEFFSRHFHAGASGTITPGARADLVMLDANPLVDIRNTRRIQGVVLRGEWVAKEQQGAR